MATISSDSDSTLFHGEDAKPRAVCRNLFGPVDRQQLQQDFQHLLRMSVEEATRRWNFDFQSERPVQGATEWEEVRCQDVPAFYRSCMVKGCAPAPRAVPQEPERDPSNVARGAHLDIMTREVCRSYKPEKRMSAPTVVQHRQAAITDFFDVKKRRLLPHKASSHQ